MIMGILPSLVESIQASDGYMVSNGSFQTRQGAAAWIIKG